METIFGKRVRSQMRAIGMDQDKELAIALAEGWADMKISTVTSRLSKALNGTEKAVAWLLEPERLPHLAATLEVSEQDIRDWQSESDAAPVLVLDPGLPAEALDYIRSADSNGQHYVVAESPEQEEDDPDRLRRELAAVAKSFSNHLVVIRAELLNEDFFGGAEVAATTIRAVPLGWQLRSHPQLLPLRDPPPPELTDERGEPMFPSQPLMDALQRRRSGFLWDRYESRIEQARASGATASFAPKDVLPSLVVLALDPDCGLPAHEYDLSGLGVDIIELRPPKPHPRQEVVRDHEWNSKQIVEQLDAPTKTIVWRHGVRYFVVGKAADDLVDLFLPHHPTLGPTAFELPESLVRALRRRNPWRAEGAAWWEETKLQVLEQTGVDISSVLPQWQASTIELPADLVTARLAADEEERARARLSALADRPVKGESTLPWLLAQLAAAPLLGRTTGSEECHVIGYFGRGRLAEIRLFGFEGEEPRALESASVDEKTPHHPLADWYDGGDVLLRIRTSISDTLGPRLP